jgi:hypothetical protein
LENFVLHQKKIFIIEIAINRKFISILIIYQEFISIHPILKLQGSVKFQFPNSATKTPQVYFSIENPVASRKARANCRRE